MTYSNPAADVSGPHVLTPPRPVILSDLSGNSYTQGQQLRASSIPVAVASDQTAIPVNAPLPSIVQKAKAVSTGSVTTVAAAFAASNTAGNSIVVVCGAGNNGTLTVTDSNSNTYTSAVVQANSTTFEAQIFYAVGIVGGANTVTVTNGGSAASMAVQVYEVYGLIAQSGNVVGQTTSGTGTSATPTISNITAGLPNELAFLGVAVGTAAQAVSATASTYWTLDSTQNAAGTPAGLFTFGSLSQPLGSLKSVQPAATLAGSEPYAMVAATFKPITLGVQGTVRIGGYNYTHITSATTTLVKTGAGVLHAIVINKPLANGVVELDDALTNTSPVIGIITLPATLLQDGPKVGTYDITFTTGLSVTTTTAQDITVVWI